MRGWHVPSDPYPPKHKTPARAIRRTRPRNSTAPSSATARPSPWTWTTTCTTPTAGVCVGGWVGSDCCARVHELAVDWSGGRSAAWLTGRLADWTLRSHQHRHRNLNHIHTPAHVHSSPANSACYGSKGDWAKAAEDAQTCIEKDPEFVKGAFVGGLPRVASLGACQ